MEIRAPRISEAAFAAAKRGNAQALLAFDDALTFDIAYRPRILALAAASRLPASYGFREFPDDGGLLSYGTNLISHFRHTAKYVDKILKGAKPANFAIERKSSRRSPMKSGEVQTKIGGIWSLVASRPSTLKRSRIPAQETGYCRKLTQRRRCVGSSRGCPTRADPYR